MEIVIVVVALLLSVGLLVIAALSVLVPAVVESVERAHAQQTPADASWQIHQQAVQAFGEMLEAARLQAEDGHP